MKYWKEIYTDKPELKTLKTRVNKMPAIKYEPMFYDSETSKITEMVTVGKKTVEQVKDTWVYLWMCAVGDYIYYGRYLHEFFEMLQYIVDTYGLDAYHQIDIWIHNASYDVSYMYDLLFKFYKDNGFTPDTMAQIFAKERQLICWELGELGITIKCTYRLTNRSLAKWCKDLKIKNAKKTGTKDYSAVYYPWDELPENEMIYGEYDIISMKECFYKELEIQGYNFANCPMTQTGFVRKDFQRAFNDPKKYKSNHAAFEKTKVNDEQYRRLLRAAQGGYTAVSTRYIGVKVEHEAGIGHLDFESHYPTNMKVRLYPQTPTTIKEEGDNKKITLQDLATYYKRGYYFVVDIAFKNIEVKPSVTMPFMPKSKITKTDGTKVLDVNGKVIKADGEIRICCTNFDLMIYLEQYKIEGCCILACDIYTTRRLPDYILDTVDKYYALKSELKEDPEHETDEDKAMSYMISKQKVNGVFGCTYTKPVRPQIYIDDGFIFHTDYDGGALDEYYEKYNSCVAFQWGCFVTSHARFELYNVIKNVIGYKNVLYSDTDSAFYKNNEEIEKRVALYRKQCKEDAIKNEYYCVLSTGELKYYHDLSPEKDHCKSKTFKALHAKCYAMEPDGELFCTIAGVSKKSRDGKITREEELGSIDNLEVGKEFIACGGTRADYSTVREYEGYTGGGAAILDNTKTIKNTHIDRIEVSRYNLSQEV